MEGENPCSVALDYLEQNEVKPVSECLPPGSASSYVPRRKIRALFEDEAHGLTLEMIFLCPCNRCARDGGSVDDRSTHFNRLREQELRGDYALIYALLIYIRRPALIHKFQKHELKLHGTAYLRDSDFEVLQPENILDLDLVRRKVVEKQYSFLVRTLRPFFDITSISPKELLPINEDPEPKGEGTFAEVRCFEFQDDEYRSREFGKHIKRFARKIFKQGMPKPAAKEWNNMQRLSKEENHPHLMVLLSAYWHGNQFFILQEEAEQSLHDYLKGEGEEFESGELWKQMTGVADGLATLHMIYKGTKIAYHKDLKPSNILIVRRELKIADFGLHEFKPVSLSDATDSTGIPNAYNAGYYAAPRQGRYTRDSDIWSLGCIMSELATCDIQGRDEVKKYKEARVADSPSGRDTPRFFSGQCVKDTVLKRHSLLYGFVQSMVPSHKNATSMQFQEKFYTEEFFGLLNRMFKHMHNSLNLLEVPGETAVPDAGHVAKTIERLRRAACPGSALDNQTEDLRLEQGLLDADAMCPSLAAHILDFKEVLNRRNRLKFPTTTVADLKQYIINLQAKQHAERRQPGFKRLDLFLKRFEDFGELIKSLPGAMEFMGFVWGPVRFLLEVTACHPDAFSNLLDVYAQVGRSQPSLAMYKELFVIEPELTHILSVAYNDIVIVNKWLVIYFQQRLWPELFSTTWKRQKSRITRVMIRMTSRLDLVNSRANLAQFDFHLHETALQDEQLLATIESENLGRKQAVHAWLKPTDMEKEQDYLERTRSDYPHTCRWLLNDRTFKEWFDPQQTTTTLPKLLWMNGKPGSGKTVLASLVVQEARKLKPASTVLFFYFMQEDTDRHTFFSMARTFLMQILEQNPDTLDYFYSKCCGSGILLSSRALIEDLLKLALANCDSTYIVLDGLDQCVSRKERGEVVRWFRDVTEDLPPHMRHRFHCLFISQNDSARKDYRDLASITVDADKNEDDIEEFSKIQSKRLVAKLGISEKEASEIAVSVSASAEGMFLFAHLVWINLCGQSSIHALEEEMKSFPTDLDRLDKIYAQRMQAIMNKPVRAQREEALMLLGRLVCAKRSLKLHEVQTMISIDLDRRVVDFDRRHLRVHLVELCESLVDVREDGTIEWVHMTAKSYLVNSAYLDVVAEELRLATLCINYLCLPSFRVPSSEESVLAGEYGLMEYAMIYWLRHLEAGLVSSISGYDDLRSDLAEALEILVEQHWNNPTADIRSISNHTRDMLETFRGCQSYLRIQTAVVLTDKELKHFGDTRPEQSALDFAGIVAAVRRSLEAVVQNNADPVTANNLELKYGIHLFRCPRFSCKHFTEGFSTPDERESHIERHQRPARCTDEHCRGSRIGFETQAQLERHLKEYHPDTTDRCHNFPTEEEINESLRETLPESEPEAEHEPEGLYDNGMAQLLAEADPAVDPAREEAAPLSTRPKDTSKRRKMKQSYECAHCGKEFNKKFNWQSHLASHGGDQRHICPNCGKACARSGDLARHMKLHNPDNAVTCGGILSNGQQWGCGRSFARVDILRSHHKSKQGRRCIAARDTGEQAGP